MAKVRQRTWTVPGQRTKRKAWGFVTIERGKHRAQCADPTCGGCQQVRQFRAEWTKEQAEEALSKYLLKIEPKPEVASITFAQAIEEYVKAKARKKSLAHDRLYLGELKAALGPDTLLVEINAARINRWKNEKLAAKCARTGREFSAAAINRPLAALRHLLQLAHEQHWAALREVPKIRMEPEPEGRIRWLEPDEEGRLLDACRKSRNKELVVAVTVALETGLRRGELLGLTWDRVDLSRGVIRLEVTKSGRRREVPMRQVVYEVLTGLPGQREGRVFKTRSIRTAFENAVEEANLDDFHFHDLRHHFASQFVMRGGSLPALQKLLGHADLKMTLRYAHLAPQYLRDEIARTERPTQTAASITQAITHETVAAATASEGTR